MQPQIGTWFHRFGWLRLCHHSLRRSERQSRTLWFVRPSRGVTERAGALDPVAEQTSVNLRRCAGYCDEIAKRFSQLSGQCDAVKQQLDLPELQGESEEIAIEKCRLAAIEAAAPSAAAPASCTSRSRPPSSVLPVLRSEDPSSGVQRTVLSRCGLCLRPACKGRPRRNTGDED